MLNKILSYLTPVLLVVILGLLLFSGHGKVLGGTTNYDQLDTTDGYSIDGTTVFDGGGGLRVASGTVLTGSLTLSGAGTFSATNTFSGITYLNVPITSASVVTMTAGATTTTLTAAQVCAGSTFTQNPTNNNSTTTLPTTASLVTSCLTTAGQRLNILFRSSAATTTYGLAAGTGQTFFYNREATTSTVNGLDVTSSTPIMATVELTLASSTDSTANIYLYNLRKP